MTAFLFLLPTVLLIAVKRGRVDPSILVSLALGQWLAGAHARPGASGLMPILAVGCFGFLVLAVPLRTHPRPLDQARRQWRRLRAPITVLVCATTVLHFARAGVPILSASAETDRFDLSSSGLLGLPSRTYLFVLPMCAIWAGAVTDRIRSDPWTTAVWTTLAVSRIAGGMKSGVLELAVYLFVVAYRKHGSLRLGALLRAQGVLVIAASILAAGVVAQTYGTVQARSESSVADYLIERLTVGTVGGASHAVSDMHFDQPPVVNDLQYFGPKYIGLAPRAVSSGRLVVASYYGLPVESGQVTTSITLGLPVELYLNGGYLAVLLGSGAAGLAMRALLRRFQKRTDFMVGALGMGIVVIHRLVGNGGLIYYTFNLLGSVVLFAGLVAMVSALAPARSPSARRSAVRS